MQPIYSQEETNVRQYGFTGGLGKFPINFKVVFVDHVDTNLCQYFFAVETIMDCTIYSRYH